MRLLLLTPEFDSFGGGIITFYSHLASVLAGKGICLSVIEGSAFHAEKKSNVRSIGGIAVQTLELDRLNTWADRFSHLAAFPELRMHFAAAWAMWEQSGFGSEFDVVEASDWGFLFAPPVMDATCPVVVQCHGSVGQMVAHDPVIGNDAQNVAVRLLESAILSRARTVQTYSLANAEFWHRETGADASVIRPAWTAPSGRIDEPYSGRGLVAGRLQKWKGPQILCEALRLLGDKAPTVEWIGRDMVWETRNQSASAHLLRAYPEIFGTKIIHLPTESPSRIADRQAKSLFNLVPSTWDVFNFTVIEGMASGRPTIVSTGAGASELVEDGVNGFVFPAGDAAALADALRRVIALGPAEAREIGGNAIQTVGRELEPGAIAERRIAAYRASTENFASNPPRPVGGWLGDICRPSVASENQMAFLENYPLRKLVDHVAARAVRRVWRQ